MINRNIRLGLKAQSLCVKCQKLRFAFEKQPQAKLGDRKTIIESSVKGICPIKALRLILSLCFRLCLHIQSQRKLATFTSVYYPTGNRTTTEVLKCAKEKSKFHLFMSSSPLYDDQMKVPSHHRTADIKK